MAFGNDIGDAHYLEHCAHGTTCNDSGTLWSRRHHDVGCTMVAEHLVVNGSVFQGDLGQVTARFFHRFLHCRRHFFGLAFTHANATIAITYNRQCGET